MTYYSRVHSRRGDVSSRVLLMDHIATVIRRLVLCSVRSMFHRSTAARLWRPITSCSRLCLRCAKPTDSTAVAADQRLKTLLYATAYQSIHPQRAQSVRSIKYAAFAGPQTGDRPLDLAVPHTNSQPRVMSSTLPALVYHINDTKQSLCPYPAEAKRAFHSRLCIRRTVVGTATRRRSI